MIKKPELPTLPALPALQRPNKLGTPLRLNLPTIQKPLTLAEMQRSMENPLDRNNDKYTDDAEHDALLDMEVIKDEFAAIHAARKQQADAIELANDSEFWCAFYFQSRAQKEAFLQHFGIKQDKYIDGQDAADAMGITLPKRTAPYKVGKVDKKLMAIT